MSGIIGGVGAVSGILGETTVPTVAGMVKEVQWDQSAVDSSDQTVSSSVFYGFGTIFNMSVPTGQSVLVELSGGMQEFDAGNAWNVCINYDTSSMGSATAGNFSHGTGSNSPANKQSLTPVAVVYSNTTSATTTLYYRCAMRGWSGGVTARWYGDDGSGLSIFSKATRFIT